MTTIRPIKIATTKDLKDINLLLPQLSENAKPLTFVAYRKLLSYKDNCILAARENGRVIGIGSLIFMRSPLFTAGYISDLVVDADYRGKSIGRRIVKELIAIAKNTKMDMVELTSRSDRIPANKLYQKMGFKIRNTNVYRMKLKKK